MSDFAAKNRQVVEDQSQVLYGATQDHVDGIALGAFEVIAMRKPVVFYVPMMGSMALRHLSSRRMLRVMPRFWRALNTSISVTAWPR